MGRNTLGDANRAAYLPSCGSRVHRDVRKNDTVTAVAMLQQFLAEQPGRANERHSAAERAP
ncbi:hypothetical protein SNOUR_34865 [Streptomyces noursei ATCC 11455]|nr:hypothetical protein SNOUR_34865 [Streptomyces noursei ATCC 11455]